MKRYEDPDEKTVFKVRLGKEHREIFALIKILAVLFSIIGSVGIMQYYFCHSAHPRWSFTDCFSPP